MIVLKNNADATLASAIDPNAQQVMLLGSGGKFPALAQGDHFRAAIRDTTGNVEFVKVVACNGDTLTVIRGQEGTAARAWPRGAVFQLRMTAATWDEMAGENFFRLRNHVNMNNLLPTRTSDTTFTVQGDYRDDFQPTRAIRLTDTAGADWHSFVAHTSYANGITTVTVSETNGAIPTRTFMVVDVGIPLQAVPEFVATVPASHLIEETAHSSLFERFLTTITGLFAPKKHDSTATTHGVGTSTNYGHVQLSDATNSTAGANDGVAATPVAVREAYNLATAVNNALPNCAPQVHASASTMYGIGDASNYGHVKLSDATDLNSAASAGVAASPKAVKLAYDKAVAAETAVGALASAGRMELVRTLNIGAGTSVTLNNVTAGRMVLAKFAYTSRGGKEEYVGCNKMVPLNSHLTLALGGREIGSFTCQYHITDGVTQVGIPSSSEGGGYDGYYNSYTLKDIYIVFLVTEDAPQFGITYGGNGTMAGTIYLYAI